jgi:hypothetical protein
LAGSLRTDGPSQEKTARLTASAVPVGYKADPFARGQKDRCGEANGFTATSEQEIRAESARPVFEFRYAGFGAVELGQVRCPCQCHYGRAPIGVSDPMHVLICGGGVIGASIAYFLVYRMDQEMTGLG